MYLQNPTQGHTWEVGLEGCWAQTLHSINESKEVLTEKNLYRSGWNHNFCMDVRPNLSLFAFANVMFEDWNQTRYGYDFRKVENTIDHRLWARCDTRTYPYSFAGCPIAEIGCPHAPHPWILSLSNSMLSDRKDEARKHLMLCKMDNGIACESVDAYTGESRTGDAFATCAGFLAYAIYGGIR